MKLLHALQTLEWQLFSAQMPSGLFFSLMDTKKY